MPIEPNTPSPANQSALFPAPPPVVKPHSHYFKNVDHLTTLDVYRVLDLFAVTDGAIAHAVKKLLVAGRRGAGKSFEQDIKEVVDTLNRRLEMVKEDARGSQQ